MCFEPYVQNKLFNVGDKAEHLGKLYGAKRNTFQAMRLYRSLIGGIGRGNWYWRNC